MAILSYRSIGYEVGRRQRSVLYGIFTCTSIYHDNCLLPITLCHPDRAWVAIPHRSAYGYTVRARPLGPVVLLQLGILVASEALLPSFRLRFYRSIRWRQASEAGLVAPPRRHPAKKRDTLADGEKTSAKTPTVYLKNRWMLLSSTTAVHPGCRSAQVLPGRPAAHRPAHRRGVPDHLDASGGPCGDSGAGPWRAHARVFSAEGDSH